MKHRIFFLILLLAGALAFPLASPAQEITNVKVSELTDAQIKQLLNEVSKMGLTMEEAAQMARLRGATETQIKELMGRIVELNLEKEKDTTATQRSKEEGERSKDIYSKKKEVKPLDSLKLLESKKIFGFDLFNSENLTFEPSANIQVPKEYVVGIGDKFIINVWGASEAIYQSEVDKNGAITISQIGPIFVNGLSFEAAQNLIRKRLTSIHNGLAGSNPNTYAIINLSGLRSLTVTIIGEVMTPGTYTLPATASAFNGLYLSGGPNKNGSFRNVRLVRDGKIFKNVDIYKLLVDADPADNIILRDQDIIFVPTFEKRVIVGGEFLRTGLFELKAEETLKDLIRFSGGFTDKAFKTRVFVYRMSPAEMQVKDVEASLFDQFVLQGGDSVTAGPILDRYANRVKIGGAVFRPGSYELTSGMTLKDLIAKAEGVTEEAYLHRGQIFRLSPSNDTLALAFDPEKIIAGKESIELRREDSVSIKSMRDLREEYYVEIQGEINDPGKKSFYENMTVQDLIYLSGGFKENADVSVIEVARRLNLDEAAILTDSISHVFTVSIRRDLKPDPADSALILQPFDRVSVRKAQGFRDQGSVAITGEVLYDGYFSIKNRDNRISDLISWSGGFTKDAYLDAALLYKADSSLVNINLQKIMKDKRSRFDMVLEPGDSLFIPKEPQTVDIVGQVQKPFATTFIPNKTVIYYVKSAGGWADSPDRKKIYVTYPDGSSQNTKGYLALRYPLVKPGSTIVVPKKPEKEHRDNSALWLATASTMSSVAVMVVTILTMLKN